MLATLEKCQGGHYRVVPVTFALVDALDLVHGVRERQARRGKGRREWLWPWSRITGWRAVHAVMRAAGLDRLQAASKGLRHGFGAAVVPAGNPFNLARNGSAPPHSRPGDVR